MREVAREALLTASDHTGETTMNNDPEAVIETLIHELAYERVKHSYLFNVLSNQEVDQKVNELAKRTAAEIETWLFREVDAETRRQNEMDEFVAGAHYH